MLVNCRFYEADIGVNNPVILPTIIDNFNVPLDSGPPIEPDYPMMIFYVANPSDWPGGFPFDPLGVSQIYHDVYSEFYQAWNVNQIPNILGSTRKLSSSNFTTTEGLNPVQISIGNYTAVAPYSETWLRYYVMSADSACNCRIIWDGGSGAANTINTIGLNGFDFTNGGMNCIKISGGNGQNTGSAESELTYSSINIKFMFWDMNGNYSEVIKNRFAFPADTVAGNPDGVLYINYSEFSGVDLTSIGAAGIEIFGSYIPGVSEAEDMSLTLTKIERFLL
jgi:hypothetical protein